MPNATFYLFIALLFTHDSTANNQAQNAQVDLTIAEQKTVRESVYLGQMTIGHTLIGPNATVNMLHVPVELSALYAKNKKGTLVLLKAIAEGAKPEDALLAGAFAISLAESPAIGAALSFWPVQKFDELRPNQSVTYRQAIVQIVADALSKVSEAENNRMLDKKKGAVQAR